MLKLDIALIDRLQRRCSRDLKLWMSQNFLPSEENRREGRRKAEERKGYEGGEGRIGEEGGMRR